MHGNVVLCIRHACNLRLPSKLDLTQCNCSHMYLYFSNLPFVPHSSVSRKIVLYIGQETIKIYFLVYINWQSFWMSWILGVQA